MLTEKWGNLDLGVRETPRDLREFIELLQSERRILHITYALSPEPDVQSYCRAASELGGTSLLLDNINGYKGKRLVINLLASWLNCALMSGLPTDTPVRKLIEVLCLRADNKPHKPMWIEIEKAPSYECLETDEVDLYKILPLFRINEHDGGFYLHKACVVSEDIAAAGDPDRMKFGMYSLQVHGRDRLGVHVAGTDNLNLHLMGAEKTNSPLPVAVCLGVPPMASIVASAGISYAESEYDLISALYGQPFELARCSRSKLWVPAYSEYVLEGYIEPGIRCTEGPFTCDGGSLSGIKRKPQIKVTAIAHRNNPILDNTYVGKAWTEHDCMTGIAAVLRLHKQAKDTLPEVARSGTRAECVHLQLGFCGGPRDEKHGTRISFQKEPSSSQPLGAYKQKIEEAQRREALCQRNPGRE